MNVAEDDSFMHEGTVRMQCNCVDHRHATHFLARTRDLANCRKAKRPKIETYPSDMVLGYTSQVSARILHQCSLEPQQPKDGQDGEDTSKANLKPKGKTPGYRGCKYCCADASFSASMAQQPAARDQPIQEKWNLP
jgi:hypothetical protein